jgi:hypothetical protein
MARFNTTHHTVQSGAYTATSPMATVSKKPDTRTMEGAPGWTRTPKTEIFLRSTGAVHGGESSFYENAEKRDDRLRELTRTVALEDPAWCLDFATWLRGPGNMRTASLMFAVEFVHERLAAGRTGRSYIDGKAVLIEHYNRRIIDAVCQRADEPGEILAIWTAWYGRRIPKPVKRGVADAARRLYTQRSLLKYDTSRSAYRFGDVLNLTHAKPNTWGHGDAMVSQSDLFRYALDRRHHTTTAQPSRALGIVNKNLAFRDRVKKNPTLLYNAEELHGAAMTWEDALSLSGQFGVDKRKVWEAMIPSMGIMALVRNLRNFDEAGVSDAVADQVIAKLIDPEVIAKSRMFPFRFLAAYRAAGDSLRWSYALERALNLSLTNVPELSGRTLILVDRSPSMFPAHDYSFPASKIKGISRADQAALFGAALALRAEKPTLVWFGGKSFVTPVKPGTSVLKLVEHFGEDSGTDIPSAVKGHYAAHDRVIVLTDEQTQQGWFPSNMYGYYGGMHPTPIDQLVPKDVPVYMWNFAGYTAAAMNSGDSARFTMGGLTDESFRLIPRLESGREGSWPWDLTG